MALSWQMIDLQQQPTNNGMPGMVAMLRTERARIPGGWLVRTVGVYREATQAPGGAPDIETSTAIGLTFVPDAGHAWP